MSRLAFDAIVLAGGRSSRLGSVPKAELVVGGSTLLQRTIASVSKAHRVVVVGPQDLTGLADGVLRALEEPPFGGPAAAIAAGLTVLRHNAEMMCGVEPSEATVVLACDMPQISLAVPSLLQGLTDSSEPDGVIAVDEQRRQPLAAVFVTSRLVAAIASIKRDGGIEGTSVRRLIESLNLVPIDVPPGSTADVDTWQDAERLGAAIAGAPQQEEFHE